MASSPSTGVRAHTVPTLSSTVAAAARELARGQPVLVYDAPTREGETDIIQLAETVTPESIQRLRTEAGGFICVTMPDDVRRKIGLPYLSELYRASGALYPVLPELVPESFKYDKKSPFGVLVNHRETFTGIPDVDRALTIRAIGQLVRDSPSLTEAELKARFVREFQIPGHVALLHPVPHLLRERRGHTELSPALAELAGVTPSLVLCEMLSTTGRARGPEEAAEYARSRGWAFVQGKDIVEDWSRWSG